MSLPYVVVYMTFTDITKHFVHIIEVIVIVKMTQKSGIEQINIRLSDIIKVYGRFPTIER